MKWWWILGASDPEMARIEMVLQHAGQAVAYATLAGSRVRPDQAYRADGTTPPVPDGALAMLVECGGPVADRLVVVGRYDHHRPGDPGYGRPPAEYLDASSLGQILVRLGRTPTDEDRLVAAADHCLEAAYRGACPGVDPDRLMRWRLESRAAFQRRSVEELARQVETARAVLAQAPPLVLGEGVPPVADLRQAGYVPELPEAAAREGRAFVAVSPDGTRLICQAGTPEQIRAFLAWAQAHGLRDPYGDPARGFAGAALP